MGIAGSISIEEMSDLIDISFDDILEAAEETADGMEIAFGGATDRIASKVEGLSNTIQNIASTTSSGGFNKLDFLTTGFDTSGFSKGQLELARKELEKELAKQQAHTR